MDAIWMWWNRSNALRDVVEEEETNYFAVKACPNPHILAVLTKSESETSPNMGLDCSSLAELEIARRWNLTTPDNIIFTSNYTSREELLAAVEMGVMLNLDDKSLVRDLGEVCIENNLTFPEFLYFRVNPAMGRTDSSIVSNVLGGSKAKFGIPVDDLKHAISEARDFGCKRFGLHAMTGSNILDEHYFVQLLRELSNIASLIDVSFDSINLGGGLGIPYNPNESAIDLDKLCSALYREFQTCFQGKDRPRLVMENGRFVTGPAGYLFTKVQVIKYAFERKFVGVNACMSNLMRPGIYQAFHKIENVSSKDNDESTEIVSVVGNLCENNDWFATDRELRPCKVGDVIVIKDVGAHGHSMGFQYNGKLRSAEYIFIKNSDQGAMRKIRRRETFDDYIATVI